MATLIAGAAAGVVLCTALVLMVWWVLRPPHRTRPPARRIQITTYDRDDWLAPEEIDWWPVHLLDLPHHDPKENRP